MIAEAIFYFATFTAAQPSTLAVCDRIKPNAAAVYNTIVWNYHGWPLWRTTCYWRTT